MLTSLPNLLTLSRIVIIPVFVGLLLVGETWASWLAFALFVVAAVTDWFDGWLARRQKTVSDFGRFLDPIADKLLVAAAVVMLVASGLAPAVAAVVILCRELLVSGLREFLAESGIGLPVSRLAKWKTAVQLAALSVLLVAAAMAPEPDIAALLAWAGAGLFWLAALLSVITGWDYLRAGLGPMLAKPSRDAG